MMERPVLVHASGGPAETVTDGVTGWHVPESSADVLPQRLPDVLMRVATDRPRWSVMGRAARAQGVRLYSARALGGVWVANVQEHAAAVGRR